MSETNSEEAANDRPDGVDDATPGEFIDQPDNLPGDRTDEPAPRAPVDQEPGRAPDVSPRGVDGGGREPGGTS